MARIESDKEDLIAEATALPERVEFSRDATNPMTKSWSVATAGFRRDGSLSIYFDQDPFYQFDPQGLLRRSFSDGLLYRSQGNTLAQLCRERSEQKTTLQRHDLTVPELQKFQQRMRTYLWELLEGLLTQSFPVRRVVSQSDNLPDRVCHELPRVLAHQETFLSTAIRKRH